MLGMTGHRLSRREKARLRYRAENWIKQQEFEKNHKARIHATVCNDIRFIELEDRIATLEFVFGWVVIIFVLWLEWKRIAFYASTLVDWFFLKLIDYNCG